MDKHIYFGRPVKALGNGLIEGLLVPFTGAERPDLHGEYFDDKTDFMTDQYPPERLSVFYQHGLDSTLGIRPLGKIVKSQLTEAGWWIQAQLDLHDDYMRAVYELAEKGVLGWSSGAFVPKVKVSEGGHIECWPLQEASLTPNPAMPMLTRVHKIKSLNDILAATDATDRNSGDIERDADNPYDDNRDEKANTVTPEQMAQVREALRQIIDMLSDAMPESEDTTDAYTEDEKKRMTSEMEETVMASAPDPEEDPEAAKQFDARAWIKANMSELVEKAVASVLAERAAMKKAVAEAHRAALSTARQSAPAPSAKHAQPPQAAPRPGPLEDTRFVGVQPSTMALAVKMALATMPQFMRDRASLSDLIGDEAYLKALLYGVLTEVERNPYADPLQMHRIKSATRHMKANDVMATDISGLGQDWVSIFYAQQAWREVDNRFQLLPLLRERGMQYIEVPSGANQVEFKLSNRGMSVYTRPQPNNLDSTNRPESTVRYTAPTTSKITKTLVEHAAAAAYAHRLDMQSLLDVAREIEWDAMQSMGEALERALLLGDTETGTTNINSDGSAPAGGLQAPDYIAWDGIVKEALVTKPAQSRNAANALSTQDYLNTLALHSEKVQAQMPARGLFVIDSSTKNATRALVNLSTRDVAGDDAALFTGRIPDLHDVTVYTSEVMTTADTDGKVTAAGNSAERGRIVSVYAPYVAYARQMDITVETDRDIEAGATKFVVTAYHTAMTRGEDTSAISYNVGV